MNEAATRMNIEEEDLSREVFPLSHYASNRKRLIEEAFSILRGHKLESTIPPSLRGIDYTELKALCLEELEKIDTLRIIDVIEGRLTSGSSKPQYSEKRHATKRKSSEADVEATVSVSVLKKKIKKSMQKENQDQDDSPKHLKEAKSAKDGKKKKEKKKKKSKKTDVGSPPTEPKKSKGASKTKSRVKTKKSKKSKKAGKEKKKSEKVETAKPPAIPGERTLMELLELEYRAKAIKALLKFQGFGNTKLDEVFDDSEVSKDEAATASNSQAKSINASSSSGLEKSVQKPVIQPSTQATPVAALPEKVTIPSSSDCNSTSVDSDPIENSKKPQEESDVDDDDKDSISSDDSSVEEAITNTIQPPAPACSSESKFELSIDVDDDLDYGNPDDIQDDLPMPPAVNTDSDSEFDKVNETDSIRSKSPSNSNFDDYSEEEEGEIILKTSARSSKFRVKKLEDANVEDFQITVRNHSSYSNGGSDIESEDDFQSEFKNTVTSSPVKSPVKLESVSESEEGELTGNEDAEDYEKVKQKLLVKSSPINLKSKTLILQDSDGDHVEDSCSSDISPKKNVLSPKINQPDVSDPPEVLTKNKNIILNVPNVDEDLDYEEADDYETLNIHCPPALEYPDDAANVTEYPDGAEPITEYPDDSEAVNEYPDDAEPISEYPDEATPITWYERWYSSKKVQKLVNSTKMCGKVRNKMRSDKKNQTKEPVAKAELNKTVAPKVDEPDVPIIGSIEEYEKLFGKKIVSQNLDTTPLPASTEEKDSPTKSPEEEAEDDDDDDALWGDIMGGT